MIHCRPPLPCLLALVIALGLPGFALGGDASGFGQVAIPQPGKPTAAENCVEPVEVMRREHMIFLDHQRDATVLDGTRDGKYSLVGCMNCHNPVSADGSASRYDDEDAQHFCADCHRYASVRIDCFECHADRGLADFEQSRLDADLFAASNGLDAATVELRLGQEHAD